MANKILVVDDDQVLLDTVVSFLKNFDYEVSFSSNPREGYKMAMEKAFDLIILDWMMPEYSGLQFTEDYRRAGKKTPIFFLTAKGNVDELHIEALRIGADDYITKPFQSSVLLAKIKAVFRRAGYVVAGDNSSSKKKGKKIYCDGELIIDRDAMQVYKNGISCNLTNREFQLIDHLERNAGRVCSREELLSEIWNYAYIGDGRTVDVTVRRTREKVEPNPKETKYIETRRGQGYKFPGDLESKLDLE